MSPKKKFSKKKVLDKEALNEKIKNYLIQTAFIGDFTQHSNPQLQGKIAEHDLI